MTDPVDGRLRQMMGRLSELAPLAPGVEELRARGRPAPRSRRRGLAGLVIAAALALVGIVLSLAPFAEPESTKVSSDGDRAGPADVRLEDLEVTYLPDGFVLEDDRTESVPATIVPDPQAPGRGVPQGSAGTMRTQRYNRGETPGGRAVVYVAVLLRPDRIQTLGELEAQVPNSQATSVSGKPAMIAAPEGPESGVNHLRWVESPHVVVMLSARGLVTSDEVRRMAEGIRFRVGTGAGPGPAPATSVVASAREPGNVRVLAANASQTAGLAGRTLELLRSKGYATIAAVDAVRPSSASALHFRPGFDAEARVLARLLGIPAASVDPSPAPVADTRDADVVAVLGEDFANGIRTAQSPSTTAAPDTPLRRLQSSAIRPDGFGPMFVGMALENAIRLYGNGERVGDAPPCPHLAYTDGQASVRLTASSGDQFDLVTVRGGSFLTDAAGVGIGSSVADLTRAFGEVDLHSRVSSINGVPNGLQTLVYLPPAQPAYAMAFEVQQGVVVAIRAGARDRVTGTGPC